MVFAVFFLPLLLLGLVHNEAVHFGDSPRNLQMSDQCDYGVISAINFPPRSQSVLSPPRCAKAISSVELLMRIGLPPNVTLNTETGAIVSDSPPPSTPTDIKIHITFKDSTTTTIGLKVTVVGLSKAEDPTQFLSYDSDNLLVFLGQNSVHSPRYLGSPTMFTSDPQLPSGCSLNELTGAISCQVLVAPANTSTEYTITASSILSSSQTKVKFVFTTFGIPNLMPGFISEYYPSGPSSCEFDATKYSGSEYYRRVETSLNYGSSDSILDHLSESFLSGYSAKWTGLLIVPEIGPYGVDFKVEGGPFRAQLDSNAPFASSDICTSRAATTTAVFSSETSTISIRYQRPAESVYPKVNPVLSFTFNADAGFQVYHLPLALIEFEAMSMGYHVGIAIPENHPMLHNSLPSDGWSFSAFPALPAGLSIAASTGVISGTPTVATSTAFYDIIGSRSGSTVRTTISIAVEQPKTVPTAFSYAAISGTLGSTFTTVSPTPASIFGRFSAKDLPSGLQIDPYTGAISGTPLKSGSFSIQVTKSTVVGSVSAIAAITINSCASGRVFLYLDVQVKGLPLQIQLTSTGFNRWLEFLIMKRDYRGFCVNPGVFVTQITSSAVVGSQITLSTEGEKHFFSAQLKDISDKSEYTIDIGSVGTPEASYQEQYSYTTLERIAISPGVIKNGASSFSISPDLPPDLVMDPKVGVIQGTVRVPHSQDYTVTISNDGGGGDSSQTMQFKLTVSACPSSKVQFFIAAVIPSFDSGKVSLVAKMNGTEIFDSKSLPSGTIETFFCLNRGFVTLTSTNVGTVSAASKVSLGIVNGNILFSASCDTKVNSDLNVAPPSGLFDYWYTSDERSENWQGDFAMAWPSYVSGTFPLRTHTVRYYKHTLSYNLSDKLSKVVLNVKYDSGIIIHINGVRVFKDLLPDTVDDTTPGTNLYTGSDLKFRQVYIPVAYFQSELNLVAVEVHRHHKTPQEDPFAFFIEFVTSETSCSPIEPAIYASSSCYLASCAKASNLYDGSMNTAFSDDLTPLGPFWNTWFQFNFKRPILFNTYTVVSADSGEFETFPMSWDVLGSSNGGGTWTLLHSIRNVAQPSIARQSFSFSFNNVNMYDAVYWNITRRGLKDNGLSPNLVITAFTLQTCNSKRRCMPDGTPIGSERLQMCPAGTFSPYVSADFSKDPFRVQTPCVSSLGDAPVWGIPSASISSFCIPHKLFFQASGSYTGYVGVPVPQIRSFVLGNNFEIKSIPPLPLGVFINQTDGSLYGVPEELTPEAQYTLVATSADPIQPDPQTITLAILQPSCPMDGSWPSSPAGSTVSLDCPYEYAGEQTRTCTPRGSSAFWASIDFSGCLPAQPPGCSFGAIEAYFGEYASISGSCRNAIQTFSSTPSLPGYTFSEDGMLIGYGNQVVTNKMYAVILFGRDGTSDVLELMISIRNRPTTLSCTYSIDNNKVNYYTMKRVVIMPPTCSGSTVQSFMASNLPTGISINTATGRIMGVVDGQDDKVATITVVGASMNITLTISFTLATNYDQGVDFIIYKPSINQPAVCADSHLNYWGKFVDFTYPMTDLIWTNTGNLGNLLITTGNGPSGWCPVPPFGTSNPNGDCQNKMIRLQGYIKIPTTGQYSFSSRGDDCVKLFSGTWDDIRFSTTSWNDEKFFSVSLVAGQYYPWAVMSVWGGGANDFQGLWTKPGSSKEHIPTSVTYRAPGHIQGLTYPKNSIIGKQSITMNLSPSLKFQEQKPLYTSTPSLPAPVAISDTGVITGTFSECGFARTYTIKASTGAMSTSYPILVVCYSDTKDQYLSGLQGSFYLSTSVSTDSIPSTEAEYGTLYSRQLTTSLDYSQSSGNQWSGLPVVLQSSFTAVWEGSFSVDIVGDYTFEATCVGACDVFLVATGTHVITKLGTGVKTVQSPAINVPVTGLQAIKITYVQDMTSGAAFSLKVKVPGATEFVAIPAGSLFFPPEILYYSHSVVTAVTGQPISEMQPFSFKGFSLSEFTFVTKTPLPAGVTMNAAGVISGSLTSYFGFPLRVEVIATNPATGNVLSTTIMFNCLKPSNGVKLTYPVTVITGSIGKAITPVFPNPHTCLAFTATSTSGEITVDSATGIITGVPYSGYEDSLTVVCLQSDARSTVTLSLIMSSCPAGENFLLVTHRITADPAKFSISIVNEAGRTLYPPVGTSPSYAVNQLYTYSPCVPLGKYTITTTNEGSQPAEIAIMGIGRQKRLSVPLYYGKAVEEIEVHSPNAVATVSYDGSTSLFFPVGIATVYYPRVSGNGAKSFALDSVLPSGLSFSPSTGEIKGAADEAFDEMTVVLTVESVSQSYNTTLHLTGADCLTSGRGLVSIKVENTGAKLSKFVGGLSTPTSRPLIYITDSNYNAGTTTLSACRAAGEQFLSFFRSTNPSVSDENTSRMMFTVLWNGYPLYRTLTERGMWRSSLVDGSVFLTTSSSFSYSEAVQTDLNWTSGVGTSGWKSGITGAFDEMSAVTRYYLAEFNFAGDLSYTALLSLMMKFNAGMLIYLNGQLVFHKNLAMGAPITATATATHSLDLTNYHEINVPANALRRGKNYLAFESHNLNADVKIDAFEVQSLFIRSGHNRCYRYRLYGSLTNLLSNLLITPTTTFKCYSDPNYVELVENQFDENPNTKMYMESGRNIANVTGMFKPFVDHYFSGYGISVPVGSSDRDVKDFSVYGVTESNEAVSIASMQQIDWPRRQYEYRHFFDAEDNFRGYSLLRNEQSSNYGGWHIADFYLYGCSHHCLAEGDWPGTPIGSTTSISCGNGVEGLTKKRTCLGSAESPRAAAKCLDQNDGFGVGSASEVKTVPCVDGGGVMRKTCQASTMTWSAIDASECTNDKYPTYLRYDQQSDVQLPLRTLVFLAPILPAAPEGTGTELSFSSSALPQGLELNQTTGVISGTPTGNPTAKQSVTVTVVGNATRTAVLSISTFVASCPDSPLGFKSAGLGLKSQIPCENSKGNYELLCLASYPPQWNSVIEANCLYPYPESVYYPDQNDLILLIAFDVDLSPVIYPDIAPPVGTTLQFSATLPPGLSIDQATGRITGKPSGDSFERKEFRVMVKGEREIGAMLRISYSSIICNDEMDGFGTALPGEIKKLPCAEGQEGEMSKMCFYENPARWDKIVDTCHYPATEISYPFDEIIFYIGRINTVPPPNATTPYAYMTIAPNNLNVFGIFFNQVTGEMSGSPTGQLEETPYSITAFSDKGLESNVLTINITIRYLTCPAEDEWPETREGFPADIPCATGMKGHRNRDCLYGGTWSDKTTDVCSPMDSTIAYQQDLFALRAGVETIITPTSFSYVNVSFVSTDTPLPKGFRYDNTTGVFTVLAVKEMVNRQIIIVHRNLIAVEATTTLTFTVAAIFCLEDGGWPKTMAPLKAYSGCSDGQDGSLKRQCSLPENLTADLGVWGEPLSDCAVTPTAATKGTVNLKFVYNLFGLETVTHGLLDELKMDVVRTYGVPQESVFVKSSQLRASAATVSVLVVTTSQSEADQLKAKIEGRDKAEFLEFVQQLPYVDAHLDSVSISHLETEAYKPPQKTSNVMPGGAVAGIVIGVLVVVAVVGVGVWMVMQRKSKINSQGRSAGQRSARARTGRASARGSSRARGGRSVAARTGTEIVSGAAASANRRSKGAASRKTLVSETSAAVGARASDSAVRGRQSRGTAGRGAGPTRGSARPARGHRA